MEEKKYWERIPEHVYRSEHEIDARWIMRSNLDDKGHGSLRIVSSPDLSGGYLRAYCELITTRRPKPKELVVKMIEEYNIEEKEFELYSLHEDIQTKVLEYEDTIQELEKMFNVKIFQ